MRITVKWPNGKKQTADFAESSVTIGRSVKSNFTITDESLSRNHAEISMIDGEFFVTDLGSSNGVYIDSIRIPAHTKTPINTFQQLSIGALEFSLEESVDDVPVKPSPRSTADQASSENKSFRKNRSELNTSASQSKAKPVPKKAPSKVSPKVILLTLIAVLGGFYFLNHKNESDVAEGSKDVLITNVPPQLRGVKDDFDDYLLRFADKNCVSEAQICKEMNLSTQNGEGVTRVGKEIFIFMNPQLHLEEAPFSKIKDRPTAAEIILLFNTIKNPIMIQFDKKEIGQIHLIQIDQNLKPVRVYRFHPRYFGGGEYIRLLTELGNALTTGDMSSFWSYARPIIQVKEY